LVRDLLDGDAPARAPAGGRPQPSGGGPAPRAMLAPEPVAVNAPALRTLEDVVALAARNGASILKVNLENDVHLVRLEPGLLEFRPSPRAPSTLAGDLKQKLKDWTGTPWQVSIAREGGAPTLAEQKRSAKAARLESVSQEPLVRAVLDRFPGAEIVGVRDAVVEEPIAAPMPDDN
jgi:DNA polymerase-3 subunit gamma/tau